MEDQDQERKTRSLYATVLDRLAAGGQTPAAGLLRACCSDQPGRVFAVLVAAPVLMRKGLEYDDAFLKGFAAALFAWDLYWLLCRPPRAAMGLG